MNYKATSIINFCLSVALFFSVFAVHAQGAKAEKAGILAFDEEVIDYGTVAYKSDGARTFTFKNIGTAPVVIADIKTSCGCTVATKPTEPIMPGESSEITVNYKTSRVGPFSKTITVVSNSQVGRKVLKIKGKVTEKPSRS
ncbi:MAG: DUF1573 domain-containing protein [Flavobacteriaceae bacterium]|nr:DUF1573 domain-containing protein [Flavobacteriaceae bacterium]